MGRRKDDPLLQAAKGFPGRRQGTVEKEIAAAADAAAAMPATADNPFPIPAVFLKAPVYWAEAIRIWKEKSDVLYAAGRRRPGYRHTLTRYCIWSQLYFASSEEVRKQVPNGGTTVKVKLGHGEFVYRTHPAIDFMAKAETALRLLDAEFGFTPMRDNDLVRTETFNASQGRLPLGGAHHASGQKTSESGSDQPEAVDPMGLMNSADSPPPGTRPN